MNRIRLSIYQPRRQNISNYDMTVEELLKWADNITQKAITAQRLPRRLPLRLFPFLQPVCYPSVFPPVKMINKTPEKQSPQRFPRGAEASRCKNYLFFDCYQTYPWVLGINLARRRLLRWALSVRVSISDRGDAGK
ncbi:MAG: DUF2800 domain-containing protein [Clostridia bacterium]|nr:DUF2800 domain-containing protein [Clostridia bacterium]